MNSLVESPKFSNSPEQDNQIRHPEDLIQGKSKVKTFAKESLKEEIIEDLGAWAEKAMDDLNNFLSTLEHSDNIVDGINEAKKFKIGGVAKLIGSGLQIMKNKVTGGMGNIRSFREYNALLKDLRNKKNRLSYGELQTKMDQLLESAIDELKEKPELQQKVRNYQAQNQKNITLFASRVNISGEEEGAKVGVGVKAEIAQKNKEMMRGNLIRGGSILAVSATLGFPFSLPLLALRFKSSLENNLTKDVNFNLNKLMEQSTEATKSGFEQVFDSEDFNQIFTQLLDGESISELDYTKLKSILHKANALDGLSDKLQQQIVDYLVILRKAEKNGQVTVESAPQIGDLVTGAGDTLDLLEKNIATVQDSLDRNLAELMAKGGGEYKTKSGEKIAVKAEYKKAFGKELIDQRSFRYLQAALLTVGLGSAAWKAGGVVGNEVLKFDEDYLAGAGKSFLVHNNPFATATSRVLDFKTPEGVEGLVTTGHLPDGEVAKLVAQGYEVDPQSTDAATYFVKVGSGHLAGQLTSNEIKDPLFGVLTKLTKTDLIDIQKLPSNANFDQNAGVLSIKIPKGQNYFELNGRVFTPYDSGPVGKIGNKLMYLAGKDPQTGEVYLTTADAKVPGNLELWNPDASVTTSGLKVPDAINDTFNNMAKDGQILLDERKDLIASINSELGKLKFTDPKATELLGFKKQLMNLPDDKILFFKDNNFLTKSGVEIKITFPSNSPALQQNLTDFISDGKIDSSEKVELLKSLNAAEKVYSGSQTQLTFIKNLKDQVNGLGNHDILVLSNKSGEFSLDVNNIDATKEIYIQKLHSLNIDATPVKTNVLPAINHHTASIATKSGVINPSPKIPNTPVQTVQSIDTLPKAPVNNIKDIIGANDTGGNAGLGGLSLVNKARAELGASASQEDIAARFFKLQAHGASGANHFGSGGHNILSDVQAHKVVDTLYSKSGYTNKQAFLKDLMAGSVPRNDSMAVAVYKDYIDIGVPPQFALMNARAMAEHPDSIAAIIQNSSVAESTKNFTNLFSDWPEWSKVALLSAGAASTGYLVDRLSPRYVRRNLALGMGAGNHTMDLWKRDKLGEKVFYNTLNNLTRYGIPAYLAVTAGPLFAAFALAGAGFSYYQAHKKDWPVGPDEKDTENIKNNIKSIVDSVNQLNEERINLLDNVDEAITKLESPNSVSNLVQNIHKGVIDTLKLEPHNHIAQAHEKMYGKIADDQVTLFIAKLEDGSTLSQDQIDKIEAIANDPDKMHGVSPDLIDSLHARIDARRIQLMIQPSLRSGNLPDLATTTSLTTYAQRLSEATTKMAGHATQDGYFGYLKECALDYAGDAPHILGRVQMLEKLYKINPLVTDATDIIRQHNEIKDILFNSKRGGWINVPNKTYHSINLTPTSTFDEVAEFKELLINQTESKALDLMIKLASDNFDKPDVVLSYDQIDALDTMVTDPLINLTLTEQGILDALLTKSELGAKFLNSDLSTIMADWDTGLSADIYNGTRLFSSVSSVTISTDWANLGIAPLQSQTSDYSLFYIDIAESLARYDDSVNNSPTYAEKVKNISDSITAIDRAKTVFNSSKVDKLKNEFLAEFASEIENIVTDIVKIVEPPSAAFRADLFNKTNYAQFLDLESILDLGLPLSADPAVEKELRGKATSLLSIGLAINKIGGKDPLTNEPNLADAKEALDALNDSIFVDALKTIPSPSFDHIREIREDLLNQLEIVYRIKLIGMNKYGSVGSYQDILNIAPTNNPVLGLNNAAAKSDIDAAIIKLFGNLSGISPTVSLVSNGLFGQLDKTNPSTLLFGDKYTKELSDYYYKNNLYEIFFGKDAQKVTTDAKTSITPVLKAINPTNGILEPLSSIDPVHTISLFEVIESIGLAGLPNTHPLFVQVQNVLTPIGNILNKCEPGYKTPGYSSPDIYINQFVSLCELGRGAKFVI